MIVLLVTFLAALLCPVHSTSSDAWCYNQPSCNSTTWSQNYTKSCNGSSQSPINIVTANVQGNSNLTSFNFTGFDDNSTFLTINNTGEYVVVTLNGSKMAVQGGDLPVKYSPVEFHLHWGNGNSSNGSEHTVNGKQYPMELQILNVNSKYNASLPAALAANDSTALAILSFFIEGVAQNQTNKWTNLTSLLGSITGSGNSTSINQTSMNSLLEGVDRTKYYRYQGSYTTPNCSEVVIWTVFKDTIKVSQDVINSFTAIKFKGVGGLAPANMTNNFRGVQPLNGRNVTSQPSSAATHTISIITVLLLSILI
ncbi:hypothetical protein R3I93_017626 [Phoxinus phoxinus]|uniref:carbonic anhydrase n=1 Tax=Phoxinus phoxinus TaxID=58324 RepID=A0AAN9GX74_9TELE